MAPMAKNCDTDVRVHYLRSADGQVRTQITAQATLPTKTDFVRVEINSEDRSIWIKTIAFGLSRHELPWSSAFPGEPTLGDMIEAAESLARGEWFKLFPEPNPSPANDFRQSQ